jgi:hypothetical protein
MISTMVPPKTKMPLASRPQSSDDDEVERKDDDDHQEEEEEDEESREAPSPWLLDSGS